MTSKKVDVLGSKMHYIETGHGKPILFLHGIPTSSYVWRNIIPHLSTLGRCIAPDLIGFGQSDKPAIQYTVFDHIKYIEKFIEALGLKEITLIMHGWGSVIGLDYAMRHEKNCAGLVCYEAFIRPVINTEMSLPYQEQLFALRGIEHGLPLVHKIISQIIMRNLTKDELDTYCQPFSGQGADKPILQYLDELPDGNKKSKVEELIARYSAQLTKSTLPKLLLFSVPGFITTIETIMWAKNNLTNLEIVDIGEELHLGQESNPNLIGETISIWLQGVEQTYG